MEVRAHRVNIVEQQYPLPAGAEDPAQLTFTAHIYSSSGRQLSSFASAQRHSVVDLPSGIYIVAGRVSGHTRSTKFIKP